MAFDAQGYRQAARQAGVPQSLIEQTIASKTGVKGWLTGGKQGLGGVASAVGNVLNLPSYALGGFLNQLQRGFGSQYGQQTDATGLGILEGIKSKRGVMTEAPETLGIDPSSGLGKAIGFGAELLVPAPPIGKAFKFARGADAVSDVGKAGGLFSRGAKRAGKGLENLSSDLSIGALRLPESSINAIEEASGMPVNEFLRKYKFYGSKADVLPQVEKKLSQLKNTRKSALGTGQISSEFVSNSLREEALKYTKNAMPESQALAEDLWQRADLIDKTYKGRPMTMREVDALRKGGFENISSTAAGKTILPAGKTQSARVALDILDKPIKGYKDLGKEQRALIEFQDRLKSAPTGRGNLRFTAFKPSVAGAGAGFGIGTALGNPLIGAGIGLVGSSIATNPRFLSGASRASRGVSKAISSPRVATGLNTAQRGLIRGVYTGARVGMQPTTRTSQPQRVVPPQSSIKPSYNNIIQQGAGTGFNPYKRVNLRTK